LTHEKKVRGSRYEARGKAKKIIKSRLEDGGPRSRVRGKSLKPPDRRQRIPAASSLEPFVI
jgi:hypothetical protein